MHFAPPCLATTVSIPQNLMGQTPNNYHSLSNLQKKGGGVINKIPLAILPNINNASCAFMTRSALPPRVELLWAMPSLPTHRHFDISRMRSMQAGRKLQEKKVLVLRHFCHTILLWHWGQNMITLYSKPTESKYPERLNFHFVQAGQVLYSTLIRPAVFSFKHIS